MQDPWIPGALTMILGLLSSLQGVSTKEAVNTCDVLNCPKGFTCCENKCCPERKVVDPAKDPIWLAVCITVCIIIFLFCIGCLVSCFCPICGEIQHDIRTADTQTPAEPPSIAPLESIWVTPLEPPPPYSQVVLMPTPTEPPPPYSLWPEGPAGQMRGPAGATL